ncbi:MAG: hypothetical protein DRQ02_06225 [Candidatus Latescibacterota bacterium]|nr:MAG: hypothetical protein DRQ02_06225 [Candidatus Latescibacterota bacterium]
MYEKTVRIILEAVDKVSKPLEKIRQQFNKTQKDMQRQAKEFAPLADKTVYITKRMIDQGRKQITVTERYEYAARKAQETLEHNRLAAGKLTRTVQETTLAHERFKMHLLSVMFFGMSLQRMFGGYIDQILKTTGVLDYLSATINLMLLPVLLPLLNIIFGLLDWFMNLDENTKKWIGSIIIAVTVVGSLLSIIGILGLALHGLSQFFQDAMPLDFIDNLSIAGFSVGSLGSAIEGLLSTWGIIGIGIVVISALAVAIKKTSDAAEGNVSVFEILKEVVVSVWDTITGVIGGAINWITSGFKGELIPSVSAATDSMEEFGIAPVSPIENFLNMFDLAVKKIKKTVSKIVNTIGEKLFGKKSWERMKELRKSGPIGVITAFFIGIKSLIERACKTVLNTVGEVLFGKDKWKEIKDKKKEGIFAVIGALIDGICTRLMGPWWTDVLKPTISSLYEKTRDFLGGKMEEDLKNYLINKLSSVIGYLSNVLPDAQNLGKDIINSIIEGAKSVISAMRDIGKEVINTFIDGVRSIDIPPITLPHVEIPFSEGTPENLKKWGMFIVSKFSEGIQSVPQPRFKLGDVEIPYGSYLDWANAIRSHLQGAINAIGPVKIPTTAETPSPPRISAPRPRPRTPPREVEEPGPTEYPYESGERPPKRETEEERKRRAYPGAPWIAHPKPYQKGGIVPKTMPILAHAGETILPAGVSPVIYFSPVININATLGSDVDVRNLGNTLSEMWSIDLKRRLMR